jgi:isopentenyl-diphosphate delta-isomerase
MNKPCLNKTFLIFVVSKTKTQKMESISKDQDPNAASRKQDHIALAFKSQVFAQEIDKRFYYEPIIAPHPDISYEKFHFLGKKMQYPIWVSSMTGGTEKAKMINKNLALICGEFGFGMGLGSCRSILFENNRLEDFSVRQYIGNEMPLYANLGIAQVEKLIKNKETDAIFALIQKIEADGLILHINPMQEWLQPEGDRFEKSALETIQEILAISNKKYPIIVKEVGQGFGFESLKALLQLPLEAIDFAASGGTNFALLELLRSNPFRAEMFSAFTKIGHDAPDMVEMTNHLVEILGEKRRCQQIIVSGGIKNCLDGYYCIEKLKIPAIFGQASQFLKYAENLETLRMYAQAQVEGYVMAKAFLRVR